MYRLPVSSGRVLLPLSFQLSSPASVATPPVKALPKWVSRVEPVMSTSLVVTAEAGTAAAASPRAPIAAAVARPRMMRVRCMEMHCSL